MLSVTSKSNDTFRRQMASSMAVMRMRGPTGLIAFATLPTKIGG